MKTKTVFPVVGLELASLAARLSEFHYLSALFSAHPGPALDRLMLNEAAIMTDFANEIAESMALSTGAFDLAASP